MKWAGRWRERRTRLLQLWAVGLAAALLVMAASARGNLEGLQAHSLDLLMWLQGQTLHSVSRVVIVAIDDAAFENLGRIQPISREYLARLIIGARRAGADVVGLDVALGSPTSLAADRALAQTILEWSDEGRSRVVVLDSLSREGPVGREALDGKVPLAAAEVPEDQDGVIRRVVPVVPRGSGVGTASLGFAVVRRLVGWDPAEAEGLPVHSPLKINFVGPAGTFIPIPADAVAALASPGSEVAADNALHGRIVLIGGTFKESGDFRRTPYGEMSGVEIHANVVHMIMTGSYIRPSGWLTSLALQLGVVFLAGLVMVSVRPLRATLICLAGALVLGVPASYLAFSRGGYWVDFLLPVIVTCLLGLGAEALARRRFREAFARYVSREVADRIQADPASLAGERRMVSILLSDLRGFTTLSESMSPEQMATRLTEYFDAMTAIIFAHRGMVNDFVGDAIMAFFGAPLDDPDHALHAVQSALAMEQALRGLTRRWEASGLPLLKMGIGIHTGQVFAGNVGGTGKVKYAVVGDAVNVTARVEGLNKDFGTVILLTEATRLAIGDGFDVKDRGPVSVKGRREPVHIYELVGMREAASPPGEVR
jgi:adenylate cyclase